MNSTSHALALAACTAALTAVVAAQGQGIDYAKIEILTEQVARNLYLLSGSAGADPGHQDAAGGRIGVLAGPDGIFMVDTQYAPLTDKVVAAIRKISPAPIRFISNTPLHGDHTAGKSNLVQMGAVLIAREEREATMALAGPTTKLVPGHGTIITRSEIVPYRDMIRAVQTRVQQLIAQGKSEQDVLAAKVTAPYDAKVPGGLERAGAGTSADRFVSMVYAQLKGAK